MSLLLFLFDRGRDLTVYFLARNPESLFVLFDPRLGLFLMIVTPEGEFDFCLSDSILIVLVELSLCTLVDGAVEVFGWSSTLVDTFLFLEFRDVNPLF